MRILKPTKQRRFTKEILGFDIETCNNNKTFLMCSLIGKSAHIFFDKRSFIEHVKTLRDVVIVASNLSFDFFGVFFNEPEELHFRTLFRGSDLISATTYTKNKQFSLTPNKNKIQFHDTFNYAPFSVAKLGKIINLNKLEKPEFLGQFPANPDQWIELINYNIRDSLISKKFLEFIYKSFEDLGATPKMTIASTSMSLFKNKYLKDEYYIHDKYILLEQFKSYYGGRTEAFNRGLIHDRFYYDFNSLYPSVMRDNKFPDPNSLRITYANKKDYIMNFEGCSLVDIEIFKTKYPILPVRNDKKVIFPYGKIHGWYTHLELREAMKQGNVLIKVYKTHYYTKCCMPFNEFVTDLYQLRLKVLNSPHAVIIKLVMNSLYGKFGQKFQDRDNWIPIPCLEELAKLDYFERFGNFIRVIKKDGYPANFCIPIWSSYITAYARLKLHTHIKKYEPDYVDTDSLITTKEIPVSTKLGDLKLEMFINEGIIVRPKFYGLHTFRNDHVKIKGLARRFNYLEFKGFLTMPKCRYNRFMQFKESLRRGFIPNEIQDIEKELTLEDDKRAWGSCFNMTQFQQSKPKHLNTSTDYHSTGVMNYVREIIQKT